MLVSCCLFTGLLQVIIVWFIITLSFDRLGLFGFGFWFVLIASFGVWVW